MPNSWLYAATLLFFLGSSALCLADEETITLSLGRRVMDVPVARGLAVITKQKQPQGIYFFNVERHRALWREVAATGGPPAASRFDYANDRQGCGMHAALAELCDLSSFPAGISVTMVAFLPGSNSPPSDYAPAQPNAPDTEHFQSWAPPEIGGILKASCAKITSILCTQAFRFNDSIQCIVWFDYTGPLPPLAERISVMTKISNSLKTFSEAL